VLLLPILRIKLDMNDIGASRDRCNRHSAWAVHARVRDWQSASKQRYKCFVTDYNKSTTTRPSILMTSYRSARHQYTDYTGIGPIGLVQSTDVAIAERCLAG